MGVKSQLPDKPPGMIWDFCADPLLFSFNIVRFGQFMCGWEKDEKTRMRERKGRGAAGRKR
jgi:hypothetical protein